MTATPTAILTKAGALAACPRCRVLARVPDGALERCCPLGISRGHTRVGPAGTHHKAKTPPEGGAVAGSPRGLAREDAPHEAGSGKAQAQECERGWLRDCRRKHLRTRLRRHFSKVCGEEQKL